MTSTKEETISAETMGSKHEPSLLSKYLYIVSIVAAYWIVSISMVFVNKYLLSSSDVQLDAPLFVTFFQCVITVGCCYVIRGLSYAFPRIVSFPSLQIKLDLVKKVLPLSVVFIAMITLNNLCLKHVGVAFYYIGRSLTTVFNVILTFTFLRQKTSFAAIVCCAVIVAGFLLGVDQEGVAGSLSWLGVFYGVGASFFVSLYAVFTKRVLPDLGQDLWLLGFYNNLNASVLFLPLLMLSGEYSTVARYQGLFNSFFWFVMFIGGLFGFVIGYVTGLQIQATSPLTHNISGTAKACAQTVLGVMWYNDYKPFLWWTSNIVVLVGTGSYTRVKQLEMARTHNEAKSSAPETIQAKV